MDKLNINLKKVTKLKKFTKEFLTRLNSIENVGPAKIEQYTLKNNQLKKVIETGFLDPKVVTDLIHINTIKSDFDQFYEKSEKYNLKFTNLNSKMIDGAIASAPAFNNTNISPKEIKKFSLKICNELFDERYEDLLFYEGYDSLWTHILVLFDLKQNIITIIAYKEAN